MTAERSGSQPGALAALIVAMAFLGLSGVVGGVGFVVDPSGASMGIPLEWLEGSPFDDYLIPGIILLVVLGIEPLIVAVGLRRGQRWAWGGALGVGIALLLWLGVEIALIGYQPSPPLQLAYGLLAVLILVLALHPVVRAEFGLTRDAAHPASGRDQRRR